MYLTTTTTPGRFYELNINKGLLLGGTGFSPDLYYGNIPDFRGCIEQVSFNSIDILHVAQDKYAFDPQYVHDVTWDCSSEFTASSERPMSFLRNISYAAFAPLNGRRDTRINFDVKTRTEIGLLAYSSGHLRRSDFLALEIINGQLRLTTDKGSGTEELTSTHHINDGQWHQVEAVVEYDRLRITVDGHREEKRADFGDINLLNLHGHFFVGGLSEIAKKQAVDRGLESLGGKRAAASSIVGCLQNLRVNGKLLGFRETEMTRHMSPECVWTHPCTRNPCIDGATCVEEGYYYYQCVCNEQNCFRMRGRGNDPITDLESANFVHVQDIVVREGTSIPLTTHNIALLIDYARLRIRESAIIFRITQPPRNGELLVSTERTVKNGTFSLIDLKSNKVTYHHDGSDTVSDSIGLELSLPSGADNFTDNLRRKYAFILIVVVIPWNNPPILTLPENETLTVVENTQIKLTSRHLNATDQDDLPQFLEYMVQYPSGGDTGFFELTTPTGKRAGITSFLQKDVNDGKLAFIHRGKSKQQIRIQVTDGKDTSTPRTLKINAVPLTITQVANTGIKVPTSDMTLIYATNLTFSINAAGRDIEVRYEVTDSPYYGEIQKQQYSDNHWATTAAFTQKMIDESRIRYVHYGNFHPMGDFFKFRVSVLGQTTSEYVFNVTVIKAETTLQINRELKLIGTAEGKLTSYNLHATSSIASHTAQQIIYSIVVPPRHGNLLKQEIVGSSSAAGKPKMTQRRLGFGANFTENDLVQEKVLYQLDTIPLKKLRDNFEFQLLIRGGISAIYAFYIDYSPPDSAAINLINNGLHGVREGGSKTINRDALYLEMSGVNDVRFMITSLPLHGTIQLVKNNRTVQQNNVTTFTTADVRNEVIRYQHDDSENFRDYFDFTATPILSGKKSANKDTNEFAGTFEIFVTSINDNYPRRVVDRTLYVVTNSIRSLTSDDLYFKDPDTDQENSELVYKIKDSVPNGEFVLSANHSIAVRHFTQEDIDNKNICFKHHGRVARGKFLITVSDGNFETTSILEIEASDSFISIVNNTGLDVRRGEFVEMFTSNLSVSFNMDIADKDIKFSINIPPRFGKLLRNRQEVSRFSLADLKHGYVGYHHDGSESVLDTIGLLIKIGDLQTHAEVIVRISSPNQNRPPTIINNRVVTVDGEEQVVISRQDLEVTHLATNATNIKYHISQQPRNGRLVMRNGFDKRLQSFSQDDINNGKVLYKTKISSVPIVDAFIFDVVAGVTSLNGLEFVFDIVPLEIPLTTKTLLVDEGNRAMLSSDVLRIDHSRYKVPYLQFTIVRDPLLGRIVDLERPSRKVLRFSYEQLQREQIVYEHFGNDLLTDEMIIMAKLEDYDRVSKPRLLQISILPINDQPPKVTTNEGLEIYTGSLVPITSDLLKATDADSSAEELKFIITVLPSNGDVIRSNNMTQSITDFTQKEINDGLILFHHTGMKYFNCVALKIFYKDYRSACATMKII